MAIRIVIHQELKELTGDYKKALVLGQMIYWGVRTKDHEQFLSEAESTNKHGWFFKKASDLSRQCLMDINEKTMRQYFSYLIDKKWILRRPNPFSNIDKTFQYRINLYKLKKDLANIGYCTDDLKTFEKSSKFISPSEKNNKVKKINNDISNSTTIDNPITHNNNITYNDTKMESNKFFKTANQIEPKEKLTSTEQYISSTEKKILPNGQNFRAPNHLNTDLQWVTEDLAPPKINKEINIKIKKENIEQQQQKELIQKIYDLFQLRISQREISLLLLDSSKFGMDLDKIIENVYSYHTKQEQIYNFVGACRKAIRESQWVVTASSKKRELPASFKIDPDYDCYKNTDQNKTILARIKEKQAMMEISQQKAQEKMRGNYYRHNVV